MQERFTFRIGERRLVHWLKEVGPNMRTLWEETKDTAREAAEGPTDPIKIVMAGVAIPARVLLQGPDYLYSGIVDRPVERTEGSITLHDLKQAGKDLFALHPIRAAIGVLKLPSDVAMDGINLVGGFDGKPRSASAEHQLAA